MVGNGHRIPAVSLLAGHQDRTEVQVSGRVSAVPPTGGGLREASGVEQNSQKCSVGYRNKPNRKNWVCEKVVQNSQNVSGRFINATYRCFL